MGCFRQRHPKSSAPAKPAYGGFLPVAVRGRIPGIGKENDQGGLPAAAPSGHATPTVGATSPMATGARRARLPSARRRQFILPIHWRSLESSSITHEDLLRKRLISFPWRARKAADWRIHSCERSRQMRANLVQAFRGSVAGAFLAVVSPPLSNPSRPWPFSPPSRRRHVRLRHVRLRHVRLRRARRRRRSTSERPPTSRFWPGRR